MNIEMEDRFKRTAWNFACSTRDHGIMNYLVEKGVDINHQSISGETALMKILSEGDVEFGSTLVFSYGCDPYVPDNNQ